MTPEKTVTEREAIDRERAAFFTGTRWQYDYLSDRLKQNDTAFAPRPSGLRNAHDTQCAHAAAAEAFPLPKVTRPRKVTSCETGRTYRLWESGDGMVITNRDGLRLHDAGCQVACIPLVDVPLVARLLANPTEEVDDD